MNVKECFTFFYSNYYKVDSMIEKAQGLERPGFKFLVMNKNRNYNT